MGIDLGTSGVKVVVSSPDKGVLAQSTRRYETQSMAPGFVEQNPQDWLNGTLAAISDIDKRLLKQVKGIGFTGQMHAAIPTDEHFQPMARAMLWFDTRSQDEAKQLVLQLNKLGDRYRGFKPDPTLPLSKIRWLVNNGQLDWNGVRYVLGAKDWLRTQFGGTAKTDCSEASGTQLFDGHTLNWDPILVQISGISINQLPEIVSPIYEDGTVYAKLAAQTGLPEGCPLYVGGGDFPTAMGLFEFQPGDVVINIGSSGQIAISEGELRGDINSIYFASVYAGRWLKLIPLLAVGIALTWWQSISGKKEMNSEFSEDRADPIRRPMVLFLPQIAGERSWNSNPIHSGGFFGLRAENTHEDLSRAVFEGISMSIREACEVLLGRSKFSQGRVFVTGAREFTGKMAPEISSVLGIPVILRSFVEPTAEGAAFLALRGAKGDEKGSVPDQWFKEFTVLPDPKVSLRYQQLYPYYQRARNLQEALWA
ncbi:hypothetical protein D2Q93_14300 [Alicyclobacillaceae bacterium I2511]|nr:hypothetical protein D2Q93_14300 [Alicyclobacillaceae bacterium I2511]